MNQEEPTSSYVADPENLTELARLIQQDQLLTQAMGEVFLEPQWASWSRILDIGCGPGGWCLDMSRQHPTCEFVGIDISQKMLGYAHMLAQAEGIPHVTFTFMDATRPLNFPDGWFDYVNCRLIYSFLAPELWPAFLLECIRILRPAGVIRLTDYETHVSNSPALERCHEILIQALHRLGRSFSPTGRSLGSTTMHRLLLQDAGFIQIERRTFGLECSPGVEGYESLKENALLQTYNFAPFVIGAGTTTPEEQETLRERLRQDLSDTRFTAFSYYATAWAQKPSKGP